MNISKVAKATGLTAKTIRYYESIGLISSPVRSDNGYRSYTDAPAGAALRQACAGDRLQSGECQELLALYRDEHRTSAQVKKLAQEKIVDLRCPHCRFASHAQRPRGGGELLSRRCESPVSHPRRAGERVREGCAIRPCRKGSVGACAGEDALSGSLIAVD